VLLRCIWPLALLLACSGPGSEDGGVDAAVDAGRDDAGHDAGSGARDAGDDSGTDAGVADPGWVPFSELADDCTIERAVRPSEVGSVRWEPCSFMPTGCWIAERASIGGTAPGTFWNGRGYFRSGRMGPDGRFIVMLVTTDGTVVGAWRTPPYEPLVDANRACLVSIGVGEGFAAIVGRYLDFDDRSRSRVAVHHTALDGVAGPVEPLAIGGHETAPQEVFVSSEAVAMWTGAWVFVVDAASGETVRMNEALPGIPQNVAVVGSHVVWEDWADLVRVVHGDIEAPGALFHRADPGDIKGFHTDGRDFAWFEGYDRQPDRTYARLELWTAPYVRDPGALEPRRVRDMEERSLSAYGGGWYVTLRADPRRYDIINIHDGTLRQYAPPGGPSRPPIYVSENEILVPSFPLVRFDPNALPIVDE